MENQVFTDSEVSHNEKKKCCTCCNYSSFLLSILVFAIIIWLFCPKQYQYNGTKIVFKFDEEDFKARFLQSNE